MLFEPSAHPGDEITIDVNLLENFEILEALLMDLFTDLEPQVQRELLYKLVQTLITCLSIVLEGFSDVIIEDR